MVDSHWDVLVMSSSQHSFCHEMTRKNFRWIAIGIFWFNELLCVGVAIATGTTHYLPAVSPH